MRGAAEWIDDLLGLIRETELGSRAHEHVVRRWAVDCAHRALEANLEAIDVHKDLFRSARDAMARWLRGELNEHTTVAIMSEVGYLALPFEHEEARTPVFRTALAVEIASTCVTSPDRAEEAARTAREAFADPEAEAVAQLRRLLVRTKLVPSGPDLLVRLDYAESRGRLPEDEATRAWLAEQRMRLMANDEQRQLAVTVRCFDLVFCAELEQLHHSRKRT